MLLRNAESQSQQVGFGIQYQIMRVTKRTYTGYRTKFPIRKNMSQYQGISSYIYSLYSLNNFSTEASFTQSTKIFVASAISSGVGKDGAIRILESSGSIP